MPRPCDLCREPVLDGQPRFGGKGTGDKSGSPLGFDRHYSCHTARYGRAPSTSISEDLAALRGALGVREQPRRAVLAPKVRKGPDNRSANAARRWTPIGSPVSEMGRRRIEIECPFCFVRFWAFVWSLSGGGKRCPNCRAMHTSIGEAYPIEGNESL